MYKHINTYIYTLSICIHIWISIGVAGGGGNRPRLWCLRRLSHQPGSRLAGLRYRLSGADTPLQTKASLLDPNPTKKRSKANVLANNPSLWVPVLKQLWLPASLGCVYQSVRPPNVSIDANIDATRPKQFLQMSKL